MVTIEIKLLQIPRVIVEGVEITFPLRRAEALVYYMACNRSATRRELVELLWETCDSDTGHKNLRNTMYVLKKAFGVDILLTPRKTTVILNPGLSVDCDYTRFMEQGDFGAYQGQFLGGFHIKGADCYDEWIERTRDKVRERYLEYLSELVRSATLRGAVARAERYAIDYLREEPSDEKMCLFLMQLYQQQSAYQKAADLYNRLRAYLEEELGIVPIAETTQAYYEILNEWNATAREESQEPEILLPSRARLLHFIQGRLRRFEKGGIGGRHLHLSGEAGTGKTFLLEEALRHLASENTLLIRASCFETGTGRPYHAWQSVLADVAQYAGESGIPLPEKLMSRLVGAFSPLYGYAVGQDESAEDGTAEDFLHLLYLVLRRIRLLLVIENIQWMDRPGALLLEAALRRFCRGSLLLVTTGREPLPEQVEDGLRRAVGDRLLRVERLPRIDYDDVYLLLQERYGSEVARLTAGRIDKEASGNLSLVNEVLFSRPDENVVETLLERSRTLLEKRVEQLGALSQGLLSVLSFFPAGAPYRILEALCGVGLGELSAACDELGRRGFAAEQVRGSDGVLALLDPNARERIYLRHSMLERQTIHERIARLIEAQSSAPTAQTCEQMEYHLVKSGNTLSALLCRADGLLLFGADYLRRQPSPEERGPGVEQELSARQLDLESVLIAMERINLLSDAAERRRKRLLILDVSLTLLSGRSFDALKKALRLIEGDNQAAFLIVDCFVQTYRQTIRARELPGVVADCRALNVGGESGASGVFLRWLEGRLLGLDGDHQAANACLERALREAEENGLTRAGILHGVGVGHLYRRRAEAARHWLVQAVDALGDAEPCPGLFAIYLDCGLAAMLLGDRDTAHRMAHAAASAAIKASDRTGICVSYAHLAVLCGENSAESPRYLIRAIELAEEAGSPYEQGVVCYALASLRRNLERNPDDSGKKLLEIANQPFSVYCRKGLMLLSSIRDTVEREELRRLLSPGSA